MKSNLSIFLSVVCASGFTAKKPTAKSEVMTMTVVQEYTTKQTPSIHVLNVFTERYCGVGDTM